MTDAYENPPKRQKTEIIPQSDIDFIDSLTVTPVASLTFINFHAVRFHQITHLKELYLQHNEIVILPPEIGLLVNLKLLYLNDNQLINLPPEIGNLVNLKSLIVSVNKLTDLPSTIVRLTKLESLYLGNNEFTKLPTLPPNLSLLHMPNNKLTTLCGIGDLINLNITNNRLAEFPKELFGTNIVNLFVSHNEFTKVPIEIGSMKKLRWMEVDYKRLTVYFIDYCRELMHRNRTLVYLVLVGCPRIVIEAVSANWTYITDRDKIQQYHAMIKN